MGSDREGRDPVRKSASEYLRPWEPGQMIAAATCSPGTARVPKTTPGADVSPGPAIFNTTRDLATCLYGRVKAVA